jgi:hypothetical protein
MHNDRLARLHTGLAKSIQQFFFIEHDYSPRLR